MSNTRIYIMRGIPGSGKNTWAEKQGIDNIIDSDSFFMEDGEYKFDPKLLTKAHTWCYRQYLQLLPELVDNKETIAVCNTNITRAEYTPYVMAARSFGFSDQIKLIHCSCKAETGFERNEHGVPLDTIKDMQENFEERAPFDPTKKLVITEPGKEKVVW